MVTVKIDKLVHGGQGLAVLPNGKKVFVWNALPGEEVEIELGKSKKSYAEALAIKIIIPSQNRIKELLPTDIGLSIQPWSIMDYKFELESKKDIVLEVFDRVGIKLPKFDVQTFGSLRGYRNKVEFSFWGDEEGLFYAHYLRASHQKIKLDYPYNELVKDQMAVYAFELLEELKKKNIRAGDLKSVIIRADGKSSNVSKVVAALFVKTEKFPKLGCKNLIVYYSNPKSPASVATKKLYINGNTTLKDNILGAELEYDVLSFFQVNLPVFELAVKRIDYLLGGGPKTDFYSGVGSIGIPIGMTETLVELDPVNAAMAASNAKGLPIKVVQASAEQALEQINARDYLIVDPPRAGLHKTVVQRILEQRPPKVCYLSCNPTTQARDIDLLITGGYKLADFEVYNFFPRTPHIESLALLTR